MRRIIGAVALSVVAMAVVALPVQAAPTKVCPNENSDFLAYPIRGEAGDPVPAPNVEPLWDLIVAGAEEEGITLEQLAAQFDAADVRALYGLAIGEWLSVDKNEDLVVCVKPLSEKSKGQPAYFANFVDNNAAS